QLGTIQTLGPPEARYQSTSGVGAYNYQWAAVAWFLQPQTPNLGLPVNPATNPQDTTVPDTTAGTAGVPLYILYRRQCLLVPDNNLVLLATNGAGVPSSQIGQYLEMSCLPDPNQGSG